TGATGAAAEGSTATLVGYGPRAGRVRRRPRRTSPATGGAAGDAAGPLSVPEHAPSVPDQRSASTSAGPARAKPPVRKLAKDLGVDLRAVPGTGPDGTVTRDDVEAYAARAAAAGTQAAPVGV